MRFLNPKPFFFCFQNIFFSMSYVVRSSEFIQKSEYSFCLSNQMVSINCSLEFFENFKKHKYTYLVSEISIFMFFWLEIERKGWNFGITLIVNDHSITFLNILIFFLSFKNFNKFDFKGHVINRSYHGWLCIWFSYHSYYLWGFDLTPATLK